jgi:hypothetical protein
LIFGFKKQTIWQPFFASDGGKNRFLKPGKTIKNVKRAFGLKGAWPGFLIRFLPGQVSAIIYFRAKLENKRWKRRQRARVCQKIDSEIKLFFKLSVLYILM